jgi:hypothetical protein
MEAPAFSSSQVSGIRCSEGRSRIAPGGDGSQARAAVKIAEDGNVGKDGKDGKAVSLPANLPLLPYFPVFPVLSSPACRNSEVRFQAGWPGAFATDTAVRTMTRSC